MTGPWVSNSSVLIALGRIDRLAVLGSVLGRIQVPAAVWREVVEEGGERPAAREIAVASWVERCEVADRALVDALRSLLDEGEAEAIALARELKAGRILLDEKEARRQARLMGLTPLGTIGFLLLAKRKGLLPSLSAEIEKLRSTGFRVGDDVLRQALSAAGESEGS